jgi:hypothetical protein
VVVGVMLLAWAAMSIRTVWIEGPREATYVFALIGLGAIVLVTLAGWSLRERKIDRSWMMLGALSMAIGLASLPGSPT